MTFASTRAAGLVSLSSFSLERSSRQSTCRLTAAKQAVFSAFPSLSSRQISSPAEAKNFTVNGTLSNVIRHFGSVWTDPASAATADGKKVLSFLLNIVSCVCALPSDDTPVLSKLDKRLFPALGALCVAEHELRKMYSAVAGAAAASMPTESALPAETLKKSAKGNAPGAVRKFQAASTPERGGECPLA